MLDHAVRWSMHGTLLRSCWTATDLEGYILSCISEKIATFSLSQDITGTMGWDKGQASRTGHRQGRCGTSTGSPGFSLKRGSVAPCHAEKSAARNCENANVACE